MALGLVLELPVRWVVRPDIPYMVRGNPWFDLRLRMAIEIGFVVLPLLFARGAGVRLSELGVAWRGWTRWEWTAFAVVGATELAVVVIITGHRWPRLWAAGVLGSALLWALSEFLFGFNQESGFRGLLMTGLLRLLGFRWALALNTFVFLIGPLHGPGLWTMAGRNPQGAAWMLGGVVATGLFFSWLRYRTNNTVLCGVLHGLVNGFLNGAAFARRAYL